MSTVACTYSEVAIVFRAVQHVFAHTLIERRFVRRSMEPPTRCILCQFSHLGNPLHFFYCLASVVLLPKAGSWRHQSGTLQYNLHQNRSAPPRMARLFFAAHSQMLSHLLGTHLHSRIALHSNQAQSTSPRMRTQKLDCMANEDAFVPFLPPASTTMLQMVMRSSIVMASTTGPVNSMAL